MGFLRRNLAFAPRHTKEVACKTLVRPKLEYAAPIWHPYHESQIGQVEKVQRTAARWTCRRWRNTSSVGDIYLEHLQSKLARIPTYKGAHLWIGGDFNLPDINWDDESVLPYATCSSVSKQLLNLAKDAYLDQMVTQPTRITETTANTLDLFFLPVTPLLSTRWRLFQVFQTMKQSLSSPASAP